MLSDDPWEAAVDWYDRNMGDRGDPLNREVIRPAVLDLLGPLSGARLLDCGCGSGYLTAELAAEARSVVGIDASRGFVELCRRKYGDRSNLVVREADLTKPLGFDAASFDRILCKMVLQYVPDITCFASECRRLLDEGGRLVVVVDHPFHAQYVYAQQLAGIAHPKYQGLRPYFAGEPARKRSLWDRFELILFPRTVSDYVEAFLSAGLALTAMRELPADLDGVAVPRVLALGFAQRQ